MASRFHHHDLGFTADQKRSIRRHRRGLVAGLLALALFVVLAIVNLVDPGKLVWLWVMAFAAACWSFSVGVGWLSRQHDLRSRTTPAAEAMTWWLLVPGFGIGLLIGQLEGLWAVVLAVGMMLSGVAVLQSLNTLRRRGSASSPRVCVLDLETGERMWTTRAELAELEALAAVRLP